MKLQSFKTYNETLEFIKTHKILNIDIRFLDSNFNMKGFTLSANSFSKNLFTSSYFKFNNIHLLPINLNRCFKDPFLTQAALVFFTNLLEHKQKLLILKQQVLSTPYLIDFYINETSINKNTPNYSTPPYDTNRNIRDEIISALNAIDVEVNISFNKTNGSNVIGIQSKNNLELLDNIEKVKYTILIVANVFNAKVNINKGIFVKSNLLSSV